MRQTHWKRLLQLSSIQLRTFGSFSRNVSHELIKLLLANDDLYKTMVGCPYCGLVLHQILIGKFLVVPVRNTKKRRVHHMCNIIIF